MKLFSSPLVDMPLSVKLTRRPERVLLVPADIEIPFGYKNGYARVKITEKGGHVIVIFD